MTPHDRPQGRPIHPECPAIKRHDTPCECTALWRGWDGTKAGLQDRIATIAKREARRRNWNEVVPTTEDDLHGFWRESERLKAALVNLGEGG